MEIEHICKDSFTANYFLTKFLKHKHNFWQMIRMHFICSNGVGIEYCH